MKLDPKHDQNQDGKDEPITGDPLEQSVVARVAAGYVFQDETNDAQGLHKK